MASTMNVELASDVHSSIFGLVYIYNTNLDLWSVYTINLDKHLI